MTLPQRVVDRLLHRSLRIHGQLDRAFSLSWGSCLIALVSYALVLSDAIRSGFAIRRLAGYTLIDTDTIVLGPYAYSSVHLTRKNTTSGSSVSLWPYKYDSTSISMRAIAKHLACNEGQNLARATVFAMIDNMIDSVRDYEPFARSAAFTGRMGANMTAAKRSGYVTLRLTHRWVDRLNDLVLPEIFERIVRRSSQAIYYDHKRLRDYNRPMCGVTERPRPLTCEALWVKLNTTCSASRCSLTDDVWSRLARHLRFLQHSYPNLTLDMVLVEGAGDFSRGGFTFHGRRWSEVVAFTRLRDCRGPACTTVAVDDYRFESTLATTNVTSWYGVASTLRALGQFYAWLRLVMLVLGVVWARPRKSSGIVDFWHRWRLVLRTVLLIPSQVVVYGSPFPVTCYVLAHLVDASTVHEVVRRHFSSIHGVYTFDLAKFVRISAVSMRSVWVLASLCHVLLYLVVRRSWSPARGVPGVPEFLITAAASSTILAQVRMVNWRDSSVLSVHEVSPSGSVEQRKFMYDTARGSMNQLLLGTTVDAQFLGCSLALLATIAMVSSGISKFLPPALRFRILVFTRTLAPYSAQFLWPANALVVSWCSAVIVSDEREGNQRPPRSEGSPPRLLSAMFPRLSSAPRLPHRLQAVARGGLTAAEGHTIHQLQRNILSIDTRSQETEALVWLVNLAAMTDPLAWLSLRTADGCLVGVFESALTKRVFLLPLDCVTSPMDAPLDSEPLHLMTVVSSKNLAWSQLLQCG
ncbi:hypothetical protein P43SY_009683 [Pythium insidiosum]|uniref:Transmembrane protein n=1 Tax=Pythium insidiosum TaxID=114742 RepID=A0AAD5LHS5_PYTIN|nr:hypothetical protein P43SY_009683 [Pythium insidiosum]